MTTLTIVRGLPGAGKTTAAQQIEDAVVEHIITVERDILRKKHPRGVDEEVYPYENKITKIQHRLIKTLLGQGVHVISADTNLRDKYVRPLLKLAHEAGAKVVWLDLRDATTLETALRRNANRTDKPPVPEEYIRTCYAKYIKGRDLTTQPTYDPTSEKPDAAPAPYEQPTTANPLTAIIVDVDGTLAHMNGRSPYDGSLVHTDIVDKDVRHAVRLYYRNGTRVLITTGRDAKYRAVTEKWLQENGVPYDKIYTRPEGDTRKDYTVKLELFNEHIRSHGYRILGVYEDRDQCVDLWRELGLKCYQVAPGAF